MHLLKLIPTSPRALPSSAIANSSRRTEPTRPRRYPLIYILHSSNMYGTERMALATALGLDDQFETIFLSPAGPALEEARKLGFETRSFQTLPALIKLLWEMLRRFDSFTFVSTLPSYTALCMATNLLFGRRIHHVQMIHGGGTERKDYSPLRRFNLLGVTFITVSDYARARLIEFGVRADRIAVVGNFLPKGQLATMPRRPAYDRDGIRKVAIVSRIDPPKRVDLLLDALDHRASDLSGISFRIYGWGPDIENLRSRAAATHPNVEFVGYVDNVAAALAQADLLLHTCPVEAFGLAVLEAMAVNLVTLVPDKGGTATLVEDGATGFHFRADDADHLATRLVELIHAPADELNRIAASAQHSHNTRFSAKASLAKYRELFVPTR